MKGKLILVLVVLFNQPVYPQYFPLMGMELHNPAGYNPAFLQADNLFQIDVMRYDLREYGHGYWLNSMYCFPNSISSAGLQYTSYHDAEYSSRGFSLVYSRDSTHSDGTRIRSGLDVTKGWYRYGNDMTDLRAESLFLVPGLVFERSGIYCGLSAAVALSENIPEEFPGRKPTKRIRQIYLLAGYKAPGKRNVNFSPLLYVQWFDRGFDDYVPKIYYGGNLGLFNKIDIGFTGGNLWSFTPSVTILKKFTIIIGVFAREMKLKDSELSDYIYTFNFKDKDYIGQLRYSF